LIAAAACCVAGIASRRRATVAWLAVVVGGAIAAFEVLGAVRSALPAVALRSWPTLVVMAELGLVSATLIATGYALRARPTRRRSLSVGLPILAALALLAVGVTSVWLLAIAFDPDGALQRDGWSPIRVFSRLVFSLLPIGLLVGAARDLAGPFVRAQGRLPTSVGRRTGVLSRVFAGLLLDELWPSSADSRRRAVEDERTRLAADLHALVLPDLRRAAADAEASVGSNDPVSLRIRSALAEVEQLMNARQSVVLEQFGLVAALEWLVERVEERGPVRVEIELEGDADLRNLPLASQRAAFRIALLALDNVVRHSGATTATVRLTADERAVRLTIADDGIGLDGSTPANRAGRGLADMRIEALATGGSLTVSEAAGRTQVLAAWPASSAAGDPATRRAQIPTALTNLGD